MLRALFPVEISADGLPDDEVTIRMSTGVRARDGHILEPAGCLLTNYLANPIVLWSHDPGEPIGTNSDIQQLPDCITARTKFAPTGISSTADRIRGLVKSNVVRSVSIGFDILEGEPIDPQRPRGGLRVSKWELFEMSFVSVPSDTGAGVTARAQGEAMADESTLGQRMLVEAPKLAKRGLYDVAELAWLLSSLGYIHACAAWEADIEADGSQVPAMLGEALKSLGATLIAMTAEEVNEMLSGHGLDDEGDDLGIEERAFVQAGSTPRLRAFRLGLIRAQLRSGRVLSKGNLKKLGDAGDHVADATKKVGEAATANDRASTAHEAIGDAHAAASTAHEKLGDALTAAKDNPDDAPAQIAAAAKHHRTIGKKLDAATTAHDAAGMAHGDATDATNAAGRSLRAATRSIGGVIDGATDPEAADEAADRAAAELDYRRRQSLLLELAEPLD